MLRITFFMEERSVIVNSFLVNTDMDEVGIIVPSSPSANPNPPFPWFHEEASKPG